MDKLFDKIPYDDLDGIKFAHLLGGAIGIGLVLFVAYFFTLYSATNTELEKLTKKKEAAERTLKRYKSTVAKEDRVAKNMARVKGQFDAYKNQMPRQGEIPNLIRRIEAFGEHRNIKMVALTLEEGKVGNFYKEIPLKVQIFGELWVTLDFIEYMQNLLRLVSLENLILQAQNVQIVGAGGDSGKAGSLITNLTLKTYSFMEGAENRAAPKKAPKKKVLKKKKKKGH
jgi:Tfp pilus assembly protein PilO